MNPIDDYNADSAEAIPPDIVAHMLGYDKSKSTRVNEDRHSHLESNLPPELLSHIECIDLLHRAWPDHQQPASPPRIVGDFRLIRELGSGGMGTVFEAEQRSMGRRVALKILPFAALANEKSLKRFQNEVRAAAALDHPHIVSVYSIGEDRGIHYFAMQLIRGHTLADFIAEVSEARASKLRRSSADGLRSTAPSFSPSTSTQAIEGAFTSTLAASLPNQGYYRSIARLGVQAANALQYAHEQGVLHRDVKPSNLLLDKEGRLYIADFGLARIEAEAGMTMTGDIVGTLRYMAPEQALRTEAVLDHRADVYSLGSTLYELLALQPAFGGSDQQVVLSRLASEEPLALRKIDKSIPCELETIVHKAISKQREDRYQSAQDLADDLQAFYEFKPIKARPATIADKAKKWIARHQWVTAGVCAATILIVGILSASTVLLKSAESRARAALEKSSDLLYVADVNAAFQAYNDGVWDRAHSILLNQTPGGSGLDRRGYEWSLLSSLVAPPAAIELGVQGGAINEICLFRDGERLAAVGDDGVLRIWNISSKLVVQSVKLDGNPLYSVAISPDQRYVVAGSNRVFLCEVGRRAAKQIFVASHNVESLAFRRDGQSIALGSRYHDVFLISLQGEVIGRKPCSSRAQTLEFLHDDLLLAPTRSGRTGNGEIAQIWSGDLSTVESSIGGPDGITTARAWPGEQYFLIGQRRKSKAHLIDRETSKAVWSTPGNRGHLNDIAVAPTGDSLALAYDDGNIEVVEVEIKGNGTVSGDRPRVFKAHQKAVHSLAFISHDLLATAGADGIVRVWTLNKPQSRYLNLSKAHANGVLISPDGTSLLYTSREGHLTVDLTTGQALDRTTQAVPSPAPIAWSPGSERKLFSRKIDGEQLLSIVTREGVLQCNIRHQGVARDAEFSPCGKYIAVIGDEQLQLYDSATGKAATETLTSVQGNTLAFTPNGDRLVYAGPSMPIVACDSRRFASQRTLGNQQDTRCIKFSHDGATLATGHGNGTISIWDFSTGALRSELTGHRQAVQSLVFTPDGQALLSSSADGVIRIWSVERSQEIGRIAPVGLPDQGSTDWCELSMSKDGERIAIGYHPVGTDKVDVRIVDVQLLKSY